LREMHHLHIDDLCSLLELDLIKLVVVAGIEVLPHILIGLKASMIFDFSLAAVAIPKMAVAISRS